MAPSTTCSACPWAWCPPGSASHRPLPPARRRPVRTDHLSAPCGLGGSGKPISLPCLGRGDIRGLMGRVSPLVHQESSTRGWVAEPRGDALRLCQARQARLGCLGAARRCADSDDVHAPAIPSVALDPRSLGLALALIGIEVTTEPVTFTTTVPAATSRNCGSRHGCANTQVLSPMLQSRQDGCGSWPALHHLASLGR
jgi:hypothetical protein